MSELDDFIDKSIDLDNQLKEMGMRIDYSTGEITKDGISYIYDLKSSSTEALMNDLTKGIFNLIRKYYWHDS